MNEVADQVKKRAKTREEKPAKEAPRLLVPTGSTLINLMCSDSARGAWPVGKLVNVVGDSSSGKTMLCLSTFAECAARKEFDDYRFIYDDAEEASEFDLSGLFGKKVEGRIEPPDTEDDGLPRNSKTIQEFQDNVNRALKDGRPFIYVLDSLDALTSEEEVEKAKKNFSLRERGKEASGSYGMDKVKALTGMLRLFHSQFRPTASLLIIISQTRDNIDPMSFETKTRSGGRALRFYSSHELWLAVGSPIKAKDRRIGAYCIVKCRKNKLTGKLRECTFPVYYDYGIDDICSCIDFMVIDGNWKADKGEIKKVVGTTKVSAEELGFEGTRNALIEFVEDNDKEGALRRATAQEWGKIEESLRLERKPRYS